MTFDQAGFYSDVAMRIQLRRRKLNLTQADVAGSIGIPRATYANVERGRQRIPVDLVWRLAVLYDAPITSLLPEPIVTHARNPIPSEHPFTGSGQLMLSSTTAK